jgi:hypothetical protein
LRACGNAGIAEVVTVIPLPLLNDVAVESYGKVEGFGNGRIGIIDHYLQRSSLDYRPILTCLCGPDI